MNICLTDNELIELWLDAVNNYVRLRQVSLSNHDLAILAGRFSDAIEGSIK